MDDIHTLFLRSALIWRRLRDCIYGRRRSFANLPVATSGANLELVHNDAYRWLSRLGPESTVADGRSAWTIRVVAANARLRSDPNLQPPFHHAQTRAP